jgi:hypothetical protein
MAVQRPLKKSLSDIQTIKDTVRLRSYELRPDKEFFYADYRESDANTGA